MIFFSLFQQGAGYIVHSIPLCLVFLSTMQVLLWEILDLLRLLKGAFEIKPSLPLYEIIWDVQIVLDYLRNFTPLGDIPLSHLTYKLVMYVESFDPWKR